MSQIQERSATFRGVTMVQDEKETSHWDFYSEDGRIKLEVKCRDRLSDQYEDDIVIEEKIKEALPNLDNTDYYVAFYYEPDSIIKVYHINRMELELSEFCYRHKRTGQHICRPCYRFKTEDYDYKFNVE